VASVRRLRSKTIATRLRASLDVLIAEEHDGTVTVTFDESDTPLLRFESLDALLRAFGIDDGDFEDLADGASVKVVAGS
jgi:hypothetical protein